MRLAAIALGILSVTAVFHGDAKADCPVDIVRAPDDVRAAINSAAKQQERCNALAVRVVTTDIGMLYLVAIDANGRVYEEIDRDRTAVLEHVMSWATAGLARPMPLPGRGGAAGPSGRPSGGGPADPYGPSSDARTTSSDGRTGTSGTRTNGANGATGVNGRIGANGANGANGTNGTAGANAATGPNGTSWYVPGSGTGAIGGSGRPGAAGPGGVGASGGAVAGGAAGAELGAVEPGAGPGGDVDAGVAGAKPEAKSKWLGIAGTAGNDSYGLRGELDAYAYGGWSFGAVLGVNQAAYTVETPWAANLDVQDIRAIAMISRTAERGAWQFRMHAGVGVIYTSLTGYDAQLGDIAASDALNPVGEASIQVGRRLDDNWALTAGLLVTLYEQTFPYRGQMYGIDRDYDSVVTASIRRRL